MKRFTALLLVVLTMMSMLVFTSCKSSKYYNEYAGEYYLDDAYKGKYRDAPNTIVFLDDGTGYYYLHGEIINFDYTVTFTGAVDMNTSEKYVDYDGKFGLKSFDVKHYDLSYTRKTIE